MVGDENASPNAAAEHRLRIALVGSCYWPIGGGMEMYLRELATALAGAGHDVRVVTRFSRRHPETTRALHTRFEEARAYADGDVRVNVVAPTPLGRALMRPVHRLHYRAPGLAAASMRLAHGDSLRSALEGADVVHFSGSGRELLGFIALHEARRQGVPFVVTPHTHEGAWGDGPVDIDLYRRADRVIALTEDERRRLVAAGVAGDRIAVIGHGVSVRGGGDGTRFRAEHGLGDDPVVLFLGRKTPDKGFDLLLEAAPYVWERVPRARFVLAGADGERRALPPAAADERVLELGRLDDAEREDAYAACDVFCLPSEAEAFGLVVLEAWHYGKPVVLSDIPTLRERVAGGGGLVAPRRPAEFGDAVARVLADGGLRSRLASEARSSASNSTWERTAAAMADVYLNAGAAS